MRKKSDIAAALLLVFSLFFVFSPARADDGDGKYSSDFSPASVTVGDRIAYTVTVKHEPGQTVAFAMPDSTGLHPFVLIGRQEKRPRERTAAFQATLAVFDIGEYALPPVTVTIRSTSGAETVMQVVPESVVTVNALTDSSVTALLPIKPIKRPHRTTAEIFFALFLGAVVVVAVIVTWFLVKRRRGSLSREVDHSKVALRKVRKLEKSLGKTVQPEECYEQLSFLIREYLEGAYRIKAFEEVTSEIEEELLVISVPDAIVLTDVLHQADLVKFAESRPGKEDCRTSLAQTKKAISVKT